MRVLDDGHTFELDNLKSDTVTILKHYKDPEIHNGIGQYGPSCQEVIRAEIARVKSLHEEKPHFVNESILKCLRESIAWFEFRALLKKIERGFEIENLKVGDDGHLLLDDSEFIKALNFCHYLYDASEEEIEEGGITREMALAASIDIREKLDPHHLREARMDNIPAQMKSFLERKHHASNT